MTVVLRVFGDNAKKIADLMQNGIEPKARFSRHGVEGHTVVTIEVSSA